MACRRSCAATSTSCARRPTSRTRKPNHNKRAGVLDEEIAFLNQWVDEGWRDTVRDLAGDVQGPYSWWSWRGQAFVNNAGWRIDYQYATPALGERARSFEIGRATSMRSASRITRPSR